MSEKYFSKFPIIIYAGQNVINITERAAVLQSVYNNPNLYYQYDVKNSERPDNISDRYYEDEYASWVLYLCNNIVDPYYQWYMDQDTFNAYISKKYGSVQLAQSKIKYYRNNWYINQNPISVAVYNNLSSSLQTYYQPLYVDQYKSLTPQSYIRAQSDQIVTTNQIVSYNVFNGSTFIQDEPVNVVFDSNNSGHGQVCFANSSVLNIQHTSGIVTTGTIGSLSYIYGKQSFTNTAFTSASSLVTTIPSDEVVYWTPVYYYDYETELNEANKSIQVLNSTYLNSISDQLSALLSS